MHPKIENRPYPIVYLDLFCLYVINRINKAAGKTKLSLFIEFRYYVMREYFPHNTFGVDQGTSDFFEQTLKYLRGEEKLPESKEQYNLNYSEWIVKHRKILNEVNLLS